MTKTTADLRMMTIAELRAESNAMNVRLMADRIDTAADYALNRIDAEILRRRRLCRAEHPVTHRVCALLMDHGSYHHSLTGDRW